MRYAKQMEVVCMWDPALNMSPSDRVEYARTRDATLIKAIPGEEPTRYIIRQISVAHMRFVSQAASEIERNYRAFVVGVERVIKPRMADGTRPDAVMGTITAKSGNEDIRVFSDADCEALGCYPAEQEIGALVYAHSFFPWSGEQLYPLPHTSDPVWALVESLHAAKTRRDAVPTSSEHTSPQADPPPPRVPSESNGGAPIDVTATV